MVFIGAIYKVTNVITGEVYIGKSLRGLKPRMAQHLRDCAAGRYPSKRLYIAAKELGWSHFVWEELFLSKEPEALKVAEKQIILDYASQGYTLYNMSSGGEGEAGFKLNREHHAKMMLARHGHTNPAKHKVSTPFTRGSTHSAETRAKMSRARIARGLALSEETKRKMSVSRTGVKWSDERKAAAKATRLKNKLKNSKDFC